MITKRSITTVVIAAAFAAQAGPAAATQHSKPVRWSQAQLDQLARAYTEKNPGWSPPATTTAALNPAQRTWSPVALDALANAYRALNPGWVRP
jgi:hypothetical protein